MTLRSVPIRNVSAWTGRQKAGRLLWAIVYRLFFRMTFHNWYAVRAAILRGFGAKIGRNVRIRRTVHIEIPWNLELADDVSVGDEAILYALGPIRIQQRSVVSQYAHLCAGTHDHTHKDFPLLRVPVIVGQDCWIAADAFIGPGVSIGDRSVVGARATVVKDVPPDQVVGGNPARFLKARVLQD
ncbi:MAG TPA: DapH/DapD/GlmU-related protein [Tepidisphaeraceae bacterium]|nr:DapH/DapD/GlmU-related protein [Tepidisphaeraceae bacterium]